MRATAPAFDGIASFLRLFELARVEGAPEWATAAIDSCWLHGTALDLLECGESFSYIEADHGALRLARCTGDVVAGDDRPSTWRYVLEVSGPDASRQVRALAGEVVHCRLPGAPSVTYLGRAPVSNRSDLSRIGREYNRHAIQSLNGGAVRGFLKTPHELSEDAISRMRAQTNDPGNEGRWLVLEEEMDAQVVSTTNVDAQYVEARERYQREILTAAGIPPALFEAGAQAATLREAFRIAYLGLVQPLANVIEVELREKLDDSIRLDMSAVRPMDIVGSSRAVSLLVQAGVKTDRAMRIVGLG